MEKAYKRKPCSEETLKEIGIYMDKVKNKWIKK